MMKYVMHKSTGKVGLADLPDWLNFDEQPPRSFEVQWLDSPYYMGSATMTTTKYTCVITKEVADIIRGV